MKVRLCGALLGVVFGLVIPLRAASLPQMRPAVFSPGARSLVNLINAEGLMKRGQNDGLVMFDCGVSKLGVPYAPYTYRGTPGTKMLADEVVGQLRRSSWTPAVRNGRAVNSIVYGTVVFASVDGKPRVRVYLNQEEKELMRQSDFISPQLTLEAGQKFKIDWPAQAGSRNATVAVTLDVSADGQVKGMKLNYDSQPGLGFASEVMRRLKEAEFVPAYRDGRPVEAQFTIPFFFRSGPGSRWNT